MRWLLILLLVLPGCTVSSYLNDIPAAQFESFEYHRGGNFSSADIVATGGKVDGEQVSVESVRITEDWGPFFNATIKLEGYKRQKPEDQELGF